MDLVSAEREAARFDPTIPIERAVTPPASWYTQPAFLELERARVFRTSWIFAARADQLAAPGSQVALDVLGDGYLVVRGEDGVLRGFHNACRHHASRLVADAACGAEIVCPYHGWTYGLDGALKSAPRVGGIEDFERGDFGLHPVAVETWGPLVFLHAGTPERSLADGLAPLVGPLDFPTLGPEGTHRWLRRRTWSMACNWKVFVDNYLDGGYHIAHVHHGLASQLDLGGYRTALFDRCNLQTSPPHEAPGAERGADHRERIGGGAAYAWIYPNLMLNRYGPILDANLVVPTGPHTCDVVFDHWYPHGADPAWIEESLATGDETQDEDVTVSESVQRGLNSVSYDVGRYAPRVEAAMHHFHRLLAAALCQGIQEKP